jgi:streptomycin 6-kinase
VYKWAASYAAFLRKPLHIDDMIRIVKIVLDIFQPYCGPQSSISAATRNFRKLAPIADTHAGIQPSAWSLAQTLPVGL